MIRSLLLGLALLLPAAADGDPIYTAKTIFVLDGKVVPRKVFNEKPRYLTEFRTTIRDGKEYVVKVAGTSEPPEDD